MLHLRYHTHTQSTFQQTDHMSIKTDGSTPPARRARFTRRRHDDDDDDERDDDDGASDDARARRGQGTQRKYVRAIARGVKRYGRATPTLARGSARWGAVDPRRRRRRWRRREGVGGARAIVGRSRRREGNDARGCVIRGSPSMDAGARGWASGMMDGRGVTGGKT